MVSVKYQLDQTETTTEYNQLHFIKTKTVKEHIAALARIQMT